MPLLCEQCFSEVSPKPAALLIEQWHTENPVSAMNLAHALTRTLRRVSFYERPVSVIAKRLIVTLASADAPASVVT